MRFHLTDEQVAIQDSIRSALEAHCSVEHLHRFTAGATDFDAESWSALMALGIGGVALPEKDGGAGFGLLEAALVSEAIGAAATPGPVIAQMLAAIAVASAESSTHEPLLARIVSGESVVTLAHGSDLVQSAHAVHFFLTGDGRGGLRLVEAGSGVEIESVASTDRTRPLSRVRFRDDVTAHLLFPSGHPMVQRIHDAALVLIAADALGGAQHCTDRSVAYAKDRVQFGQPIGRFQGVKHQLAHMALDVEPARALVWYAAYAWDAQLPDASRAATMAKAHLCEAYTRATRAAIAVHGGIGYTWEYGLHYWFRRSIYDRAWLGSPRQLRADAASRAGW